MIAAQTSRASTGTSVPEMRPETATDSKWRRYRLKKQRQAWRASGEAFLYTECMYCAAPIKPSFVRGFCPGGHCRQEYLQAVPIHRVVPITGFDRRVSARVAEMKGAGE